MSLIAGCFTVKEEPDAAVCLDKLKAFPILSGETDADYEYLQIKGPQTFVCAKYKSTIPPQLYRGENETLSVLTLGFHDLTYPITWADGFSVEETVRRIQDSEGEFVSVLVDRRQPRIFIINDRFGSRPLYFMQKAEGVWFSSNAAFLPIWSGQKARPDPLGILQLACYGHTLTPQTHTLDMQRLFPGTCLSVTGQGLRQKAYWQLGYDIREAPNPAVYAEEVFKAFCRGVQKKVHRSPVGFISLSGGLDSRLVVGAAHRLCNYFVFTFSNDTQRLETPDVTVARQICRRLGLEHRVVQMTTGEASAVADQLVRLTGGMHPFQHPLKNWQAVKLMQETTRFKIGGGCGDPIAGDYINSIYQIEPDWTDTLVRLYAKGRNLFDKGDLCRIFRKGVVAEHFDRTEEAMTASLRDMRGPTAAHKIAAWSQVYYNSGFTFCGATHNHPDISEASPHLGYDYVDHMLRLPADWLYKKSFYKYMIYQQLPELRDIIYANTGQFLPSRMETQRLSPKKRLMRTVGKQLPFFITAAFWGRPQKIRSSAPGVFASDRRLFTEMNEMLSGLSAIRDIIEPDACRKFFADYEARRPTFRSSAIDDEMFGSLISLFYWFKHNG